MHHKVTTVLIMFCAILFTVAAPILKESIEKRIEHSGDGTWFEVGTGACGYTDTDSDPIVAISVDIYGSGGNCNQWISITNTNNGQSAYGKTRDECMGCAAGDLDMSPSLFEELGTLDEGVIPINWHFMNKDWSP